MNKTKRAMIFMIAVAAVFYLFSIVNARPLTPNQNHSMPILGSPLQRTSSILESGSLDKQLNNYSNYSSTSHKAAKNALEGSNNIGGRLHFNAYKTALRKGYHEFDSSVKIGDLFILVTI